MQSSTQCLQCCSGLSSMACCVPGQTQPCSCTAPPIVGCRGVAESPSQKETRSPQNLQPGIAAMLGGLGNELCVCVEDLGLELLPEQVWFCMLVLHSCKHILESRSPTGSL